MPLGLTSELNNGPSLLMMARFNESIKATACRSVQTFATTGAIGVAVGVKTEVGTAGGGAVTVGKRITGCAPSGVGVGTSEYEILQPVRNNNPNSRMDNLIRMAFSSQSTLTIISLVI